MSDTATRLPSTPTATSTRAARNPAVASPEATRHSDPAQRRAPLPRPARPESADEIGAPAPAPHIPEQELRRDLSPRQTDPHSAQDKGSPAPARQITDQALRRNLSPRQADLKSAQDRGTPAPARRVPGPARNRAASPRSIDPVAVPQPTAPADIPAWASAGSRAPWQAARLAATPPGRPRIHRRPRRPEVPPSSTRRPLARWPAAAGHRPAVRRSRIRRRVAEPVRQRLDSQAPRGSQQHAARCHREPEHIGPAHCRFQPDGPGTERPGPQP